MNRPRIAAVLSATLGSTAGFIILSRWRLAGTITGAALVPLIFTLVSHFSTETLERMAKWARRRMPGRKSRENPGQLVLFDFPAEPKKARPADASAEAGAPKQAGRRLQWSLATFAFLAFAVSIYSLVHVEPSERTIVRERVIESSVVEKTVTVTSLVPAAPSVVAAVPVTSSTTIQPEEPGEEGTGDTGTTTSSTTTTILPDPID